ncbi:hypothetical protein [Parvibaculum sp.]|uniref:hypothetical protein n=1 Tax=Parvibaculum sp. TaxID=2024848 RepID=UPI0034A05778
MTRLKLLLSPNLSLLTEKSVFEFLSGEWPHKYTVERFDGRVSIYLKDESGLTEIENRFPGIVQDVKYVC